MWSISSSLRFNPTFSSGSSSNQHSWFLSCLSLILERQSAIREQYCHHKERRCCTEQVHLGHPGHNKRCRRRRTFRTRKCKKLKTPRMPSPEAAQPPRRDHPHRPHCKPRGHSSPNPHFKNPNRSRTKAGGKRTKLRKSPTTSPFRAACQSPKWTPTRTSGKPEFLCELAPMLQL